MSGNDFEGPALDPVLIGNEGFAAGFAFGRHISPHEVTGGLTVLAAHHILQAALDGLKDAADEIVMPLAVERAPILLPENLKRAGRTGGDQGGEPGELRESGSVELQREERQVALSFDTVYASLQHERLDWHHDDGQAKFLESAMNDTRSQVLERVAAKVREVTSK